MMKKKSQIQIFETIAVVFVFFILVVIGFVFYGKFIRGNLETIGEESAQSKSIAIAQRAMFMPELQHSEDNIIKDDCIDILKIDAAKKTIGANEIYYYDLLEFSSITLEQIYPENEKWELYSRKSSDFRSSFTTNVPVCIFDPNTKLNGFGIMTIETLTK